MANIFAPCRELMTQAGIFSRADYLDYAKDMHPDRLRQLSRPERLLVSAKHQDVPFHLVACILDHYQDKQASSTKWSDHFGDMREIYSACQIVQFEKASTQI